MDKIYITEQMIAEQAARQEAIARREVEFVNRRRAAYRHARERRAEQKRLAVLAKRITVGYKAVAFAASVAVTGAAFFAAIWCMHTVVMAGVALLP